MKIISHRWNLSPSEVVYEYSMSQFKFTNLLMAVFTNLMRTQKIIFNDTIQTMVGHSKIKLSKRILAASFQKLYLRN